MRRGKAATKEAYLGKLALYQTYEDMGLKTKYMQELLHRVVTKRVQAKYKGMDTE